MSRMYWTGITTLDEIELSDRVCQYLDVENSDWEYKWCYATEVLPELLRFTMRKDSDSHGWPINSGHKKAIPLQGIEIENVVPFTREKPGHSKLTSYKDNGGNWADEQVIAHLMVGWGGAFLAETPPLAFMSAEQALENMAGTATAGDRQRQQHDARRLEIITTVHDHPGEFTANALADDIAGRRHREKTDGFSKSTVYRQIEDMLSSTTQEITALGQDGDGNLAVHAPRRRSDRLYPVSHGN